MNDKNMLELLPKLRLTRHDIKHITWWVVNEDREYLEFIFPSIPLDINTIALMKRSKLLELYHTYNKNFDNTSETKGTAKKLEELINGLGTTSS